MQMRNQSLIRKNQDNMTFVFAPSPGVKAETYVDVVEVLGELNHRELSNVDPR